MTRKRTPRLVATALAASLAIAACGGDDSGEPTGADTGTAGATGTAAGTGETGATETSATETSGSGETSATGTAAGTGEAVDLASVCPADIPIQTDWFPEAEYGALFRLIGDDYQIDADNKVVSGSLVDVDGTDTGVDVEVRAGGPAIGSGTVAAEMYTDRDIVLGYGTTDSQFLRSDTPLLSVMAPLELNPQIIYWDPETYPDIETLADLGEEGVTINVFSGGTFADVFVAKGIWNADQIDPSYDGSPQRFIASGDIAQQGFASSEPWLYKNQYTDFGRDLAYQLLNDAGFPVYSQTLAIRPDELETLRPCLTELIPLIQRATVDYYANPDETNALIVEAVDAYDTFWTYPAELAEFSVQAQLDLGLAGNGPDDTVGNMEESRIQDVLDSLREANMDVPDDVVATDIFTNEFIDPGIGF